MLTEKWITLFDVCASVHVYITVLVADNWVTDLTICNIFARARLGPEKMRVVFLLLPLAVNTTNVLWPGSPNPSTRCGNMSQFVGNVSPAPPKTLHAADC